MGLLNLSCQRGPDSQDYFTDGKSIQLGFNRLAVLDLSENGNQPIHSPSNRYTMVFNGEIYNYLDLRNSLEEKGYKFRTKSDTETILLGYKEWGPNILNLLRGMFAFAIWDGEKK